MLARDHHYLIPERSHHPECNPVLNPKQLGLTAKPEKPAAVYLCPFPTAVVLNLGVAHQRPCISDIYIMIYSSSKMTGMVQQ